MKFSKNLIKIATLSLALSVTAAPLMQAYAATPADMLVIANRIDDITTLDPAESFEFAGSDVSRNVYGKLVNFEALDLNAGYGPRLCGNSVCFSISALRSIIGARSIVLFKV